jgi:hypothetical protein
VRHADAASAFHAQLNLSNASHQVHACRVTCGHTGSHSNRLALLLAAQHSLHGALTATTATAAGGGANEAPRLTRGDVSSLLQLLVPGFPLASVKQAWSSAVAIQGCEWWCCGGGRRRWRACATHDSGVPQLTPSVSCAGCTHTPCGLPPAGLDLQDEQQGGGSAPCPAADGSSSDSGRAGHPPAQERVQLRVFRQCFEVTLVYERYLMALRETAFDADTKQCERMHT